MFKNYFTIAWRNFIKRKFYSAINIFGLAVGIACSFLLYLFISYHLSFDGYHKNASTTYRVLSELNFGKILHEKGASVAMYHAVEKDVAQVLDAAVILSNYTFTITVNDSSKTERRFKEDKKVALVSPEWFTMFNYKWIAGDASELNTPNTAVITQKQSLKLFGNSNPIGKVIVFENTQPITIVGLLSDRPHNTDLKSDIYVSISSLKNIRPDIKDQFFTDWGWMNSTTSLYITLNSKKSKTEVESVINKLAKDHFGDIAQYYHFWLQPLADVHFNIDYGGAIQKSLLMTLAIIGLLILIIASFNYINISIAQQSKRMAEIGTRKVLGGTKWQLFTQFIVETFIIVSIAILLAVIIVAFLLPVANQFLFSQYPLHLPSYKEIAFFSGILLITLVFLPGFYPAFVLSRIHVFKALKNETGTWKAGKMRRVLVIGQNTIAYILIICAIIMVLQVRYLKNNDIGFNRDAIVLIPLPDSSLSKKDFLRQQLEKIHQVSSFTFCFTSPASENNQGGSVKFDNRSDWESWPARTVIGDTSYLKSFEIEMIAGRNFRVSKASHEYLINETMIKKLGLKNPSEAINKTLEVGQLDDQHGTIVGVVKDFNTKSLEVPIEPVVIANFPDRFTTVAVKLTDKNFQSEIQKIRKNWEEVYPREVFEYHFLDSEIARLYQKEDLQQKIISLAGAIAIIISCLGLLGLSTLITLQRTKEIGIRKVVGASASSIVIMLSGGFLKLVLISFIIASPFAWWVMNKWLQNFAYRINIPWWVFALAGMLALLIALLSVSYQAIKAAMANPVESLRSE